MTNRYILSIDQSTSGTKALLFDNGGVILKRVDVPHEQFYPKPGWVEHDALEIYRNTLAAVKRVITESKLEPTLVEAVAVTNQRETAVVWNRRTGLPVYNAVVWQCRRGEDICETLEKEGLAEAVQEKTGLVLSPYFSASKIRWILDHVDGARAVAERGDLLCGTMDSWLIWNFTHGKMHATDYSNASRTQLFNISSLSWDRELLEAFAIPATMMGEVKYSDEEFGRTDLDGILPRAVPISGVMGDSHAALFGQNCFYPGMAKATYGTGSSIMMNIGDRPLQSKRGLVTSIAWGMQKKIEYVFEGNINCSGSTIQWLVDDLELIASAKEAGSIAASVPDNQGVYLVPAFVGLSAPYWDSAARASISGISRGTKKAHIVRAAEESMAYQIKDILDLMTQESGAVLKELRVDGGPTKDAFLMQFQADILNISVVRSSIEELSAAGSAYMAGISKGFWDGKDGVAALRNAAGTYRRAMEEAEAEVLYSGWLRAVARTLSK
jgi:glycerol kinase